MDLLLTGYLDLIRLSSFLTLLFYVLESTQLVIQ